ncbi:MAG: methyltransferase [Bdellovibrionales bacterium RIFOXYC1_FULL_54_43]|nr:MAG: methyltransferase [Bdellovibrionales bacterium RIFOXYC1_FULL_54_43]OFZ83959.1 MAG: methyltransferase [Bdellovibrionales bacterium RIFOXYD1_FULL_55_31]
MYQSITQCRICGNRNLKTVLDLGNQALTGIFPETKTRNVGLMPLELVKCMEQPGKDHCGLLQLKHTGNLSEFYGKDYGYRSGLNKSMVLHLQGKVKKILDQVKLGRGDLVIDIGSNDSTTLQAYPKDGPTLVGIDPTGVKFSKFYPPHIRLIPDFFSAENVTKHFGSQRAKIITSFSMFYDLEDPLAFMRQISEVLANDGIWVFEQSYMPTMLERNSYDTICHEHLEYYALHQIRWMTERLGLMILDVEFNDINGGSFSISVAKKGAPFKINEKQVNEILAREKELGLHTLRPYEEFKARVYHHREELLEFIRKANASGKKVFGYGASTKGNVLLQFCDIRENDVPCIAEVNPDKFGCFTPGTLIPIVSEAEAKKMKPEYFLVLPWHFRENILGREQDYLNSGGKFLFPLPKIDVV